VNSSLAALILTSSPIWFAVFDTIRPGGKRPKLNTILGIIVGSGGVLLLVFGAPKHSAGANSTSLASTIALVAACAFWAGGSLYNKYHTASASPWMSTAAQMLCGGVANCVMALIQGNYLAFQPSHLTPAPVLAFVYLVIFGSIAGFSAYVWLLTHCAPAKVATYAYVNPVIATFLGWLILREPITPAICVAALIILTGVLIVQWPTKKAPAEKTT
jgi:drug/metabolite transporter (DMT)-like permease